MPFQFPSIIRLRRLFIAVVAIGALVWSASIIFPSALSLETRQGEAEISFSANRSVIIWPITCVTVQWKVEHTKEVYLNGFGKIGADQSYECLDSRSKSPALKLKLKDETFQEYTLNIIVIDLQWVMLILFSLALVAHRLFFFDSSPGYLHSLPMWGWLKRYKGLFVLGIATAALAIGLMSRVYIAFGSDLSLYWDETYYSSIAVTGAHGLGLYPYIQNFRQIPIMPGIGYAAYLYVGAVQIFGASIYSLRLVALIAGISTLIPMYLTTRIWYGSAAAMVTLALTPFSFLYQLTNTVRMDSFTIAAVAWALWLVAFAFEKQSLPIHLLAGFVFGLALQAHLQTLAAATAVILLYLIRYIGTARKTKKWLTLSNPLVIFIVGYVFAVGLYICFNILPDVNNYFHMAGVTRVLAALSDGTSNATVLDAFFSPKLLLTKEIARYTDLFARLTEAELGLWIISLIAMFIRRNSGDNNTIILIFGLILAAPVFLNNSSIFYIAQLLPILFLPLAPLLTDGLRRTHRISWKRISSFSLVVFIVVAIYFIKPFFDDPGTFRRPLGPVSANPVEISLVKAIAPPDCQIAGNGALYVPYFLDYARFNSTRNVEVGLGKAFAGLQNERELWKMLQPDLVFGDLDNDLKQYVAEARYVEIASKVWIKTQGKLTPGCKFRLDL